jgi:Phosphotransferase enzyme family
MSGTKGIAGLSTGDRYSLSGTPVARLLDSAVERRPIGEGQGYSGAKLERLVLANGTVLVVKRISQEYDLAMKLTHDTGRAARLWVSGVLDRLPPVIDHAVIAAWPDGDGWIIAMRDVSDALVPKDRVLSRAENYRIFEAVAAMYETFRGERIESLCTLTDRYALLSPVTAKRERSSNPLMQFVGRGWELFADVAPGDVAAAVFAILDRPGLLARQLERCETTLVHGDFWLANVGLAPDRVVMLDWGLAAAAPAAVDFAAYLATSGSSIAATHEQLLDDFRAVCGERHDERALRLALVGGLVEMGWNKAMKVVDAPDEARRARVAADLDWWVRRVRESLDTWSPV